MVFSWHQASRDFGLFSTTDTNMAILQGRQLADSVISFVIRTRAEAAKITIQKSPSKRIIQETPFARTERYTPNPRCPCAAYTV